MSGFLVFDCETTGLPIRRNLSVRDVDGWPRLVQLAWAVYDAFGRLEAAECRMVRPDGFLIPPDSTRIHGISHERALAEGNAVGDVLGLFARALDSPFDAVIAHNLEYDRNVVGAELIRAELPSRLFERPGLCTMKTTTDLLKIPGPYGYKWPKLEELYLFLFEAGYEGAHDAALDVEATARCFFELRRRGHYPRA
ncbi:MAG: 3'-5' exonuclease [Candidatus Aminicenantes bacterium]|nr:3'-5' exonuclease [Candidatus Aminicenantes bacterium]